MLFVFGIKNFAICDDKNKIGEYKNLIIKVNFFKKYGIKLFENH